MSIDSILNAIGALAPTYDSDVSITVYGPSNYTAIPDALPENKCPCRFIIAPDTKVGADMSYMSLGNTARLDWKILDRLFLFPANLSQGIETQNLRLYRYAESYADTLRQSRCLGLTNVSQTGVNISVPYVREYPYVAGATQYYIVDCVVSVMEILNG